MASVMVATSLNGSSRSPSLFDHHAADLAEMSSGKFGRAFDMHRFKAVFPSKWASFLRANFRNSTHVAVFFDCDDRTARHWLEGTTAPSGAIAIVAASRIPGAVEFLMGTA
jgi:hypothetical protein